MAEYCRWPIYVPRRIKEKVEEKKSIQGKAVADPEFFCNADADNFHLSGAYLRFMVLRQQ